MSDSSKAVFLSYASQDAEAAKRICDALRAAGVEVWFDAEGGLEHGDEWDAKIRRQIKECVLFIAVISANTQAREEGYFRIEWDLAAERARGIASGVAFILPVLVDGTREPEALVPDRFRAVQWTKLPGGTVPPDVLQRFLKLWSHRTGALKAASAEREVGRAESGMPTGALPQPAWKAYVRLAVVCLAIAGGAVAWLSRREAVQKPSPAAGPVPAPISESRQLVARARALIDDDLMAVRENFRLADEFSRRAVALDATEGEAWATAARVSALMLQAKYEMTPERKETAKTQVERAGRLAPDSIETGLALATYLEVNNDPGEAERLLRRLIQQAPADKRLWRSLATNLANNGRDEEALATLRQPAGLLEEDPQAQSLLAYVLSQLGRYREEEAVLDRVLQRSPTKLAYYYQLVMLGFYRSDLAAASRTLEKIPAQLMQEDSMINSAAEIWLRLGEGEKALQVLQKSPRDFLEEGFEVRPKGFLTGAALQLLGRPTAASAEWRQALVVVENRLVGNPNQPLLLYWKGVLQALTGQKVAALETRKLYREFEAKPNAWFDAILLVAVGENEQAIQGLERAWPTAPVAVRSEIRSELLYGPWLAAIRVDPRMQRLISEQTATIERDRAGPIATSAKIDDKSVAVLAFANLSDDKANEYFSDGISEELLTVLQKIPGLHVAARTSAFFFKGKNATAQEIGEKLGVATLVEGSVRKSGNSVRITARLSRAATGEQLWSESYTRDLKDVFAVQSELAETIVGQLRAQLGGAATKAEIQAQVSAAEKGGTKNLEAHELYLQGKYFLNRATLEDMAHATTLLQRAVELDPSFALAWAALSGAGWFRGGYGLSRQDFDEGFALARRAADQAVAIEPALAAGHIARLDIQSGIDFDWQGAKESLRRAQALAPGDAAVIFRAAQLAYSFGQMERATELIRQTVALDPVNPLVYTNAGYIFLSVHRFDEAEAAFRRVQELSPASPWGHAGVAMVLVATGRSAQAATEAARESNVWSRLYALSLARWGQKDRPAADKVLAEFIAGNADVAAYQVACAYAYRGEADRAFEWLERAYRQRDPGLGWGKEDYFLQGLHADPRWPAFLKKLGVAGEQLP